MYMKIGWGKIRPGEWAEFETAYATAVCSPIKGLRGRWLAQDSNDPDGAHSITLWDDLESLREYEQSEVYNEIIVPACERYFDNRLTVHVSEIKRQW
ncbi:antibiotic biosynthesis monooxygenase family protein [Paraburkholderia xenovorans LB400]|uniref:ABM domain-containing protein n=1 Tax=Paraburkholderia xenovorans (strain LB400) TaxID=266265 RepID=Q13GF9_PARXL|nr:antibiotic biosynthesis monooxygenase [Paraburkholderia xenovorans]ABE36830.1 hypothetical protein Bxe_C0955 [Paraburkholderia xenovorans LB400]AIP34032.1 antibiotic biosynthesis monooxygenase family protein [Paraburkholderia xenovorans LB400]